MEVISELIISALYYVNLSFARLCCSREFVANINLYMYPTLYGEPESSIILTSQRSGARRLNAVEGPERQSEDKSNHLS